MLFVFVPIGSVLFIIVLYLIAFFFFIVFRFFVLLTVYVIGGVLINKYKFGVQSMPEMCPNYQFWAGVPSLIKVEYAAQCHYACYRIKPKKSKSRSPPTPYPIQY